ncbi:mitochondrial pyruvate carrier 4 isoform X1 [Benincasa hispida]|uniref:mitochondrial pyruvate carrier 4 isoform X1 n=1 Tax=Benincasa hispida TaxID=102211 RepID=UPI0019013E26|nr:mitochondrial pyruvate carrier 4 isoform X1 [Benincasa hispida]
MLILLCILWSDSRCSFIFRWFEMLMKPREFNRIISAKSETSFWQLLVSQVHFWAPTFKWGISIANIADFSKPPEKISYPQQIAVTATGVIWSRYSTVITPKNWNLFSVNIAMAGTGIYQLTRKIQHDYFSKEEVAAAKE